VLVEIRDELRALRRDLCWQDDEDVVDGQDDQDDQTVPVDGR
jgi:hypothetical protein